jgi:hypothetical protein
MMLEGFRSLLGPSGTPACEGNSEFTGLRSYYGFTPFQSTTARALLPSSNTNPALIEFSCDLCDSSCARCPTLGHLRKLSLVAGLLFSVAAGGA